MTYFKRALIALVLSSGLAPAFAQVPAPVPALPDTERRTSYSITATTCACSVGFALFGDSTDYQNWVEVFINGVRKDFNDATFGWTITTPSGSLSSLARPITNAVLTFNAVQTGTVQIVGARRPRRAAQFSENAGVSARNLNQVFTDIISQNREIWDKNNDITGRGLFSQPGVTLGPLPLPSACANGFLGFDATGLVPLCRAGGAGSGNMLGPLTATAGNAAVFGATPNLLLDFGQPPVGSTRTISTTAPLAGGGNLTADRTFSITTNGIDNTLIRQSVALSLVGRSANSTGNVADISAVAASSCAFIESGSTIICGQLATAGIANNAVTLAKLATQAANTTLANATAGVAVPTAFAMPSCSTTASALNWTTSTGFGCNSAISVAIANVTGLGTGVATALGVNVGTAGAFVTFNGALGTPSSGTGTNLTGIPTTGLTGTLAAAQFPAQTGDVTNTAGSLANTITAGAVTLAKQANLAANSFQGNNTGSAAAPIALTVPQARALIGEDQRSPVVDAAYTMLTTDYQISYTSISAARIVTLLAASTLNGGRKLWIRDASGTASATNTISIAPNGADTIDGSNTTQVVINQSYGGVEIETNGSNGWFVRKISLTGDMTGSVFIGNALPTTISANAVTNAKLATMAANTVKGNATGGAAVPTDVTPATARSSSLLNVDQFTGRGDAIYTILATDRTVGTNAAFTASRTWTLPAANAINPGQEIIVADFQGTVGAVNTLIITRAGADTINGAATSVTMTAANGAYLFRSDGTSKWTAQSLGAATGGGVTSVTCGTGMTGGTITTSGTCATDTAYGGAKLLNTLTASASATLSDITNFTSSFNEYDIVFENILAATNNVTLQLQIHTAASFPATSYVTTAILTGGSTTISNQTTFFPLSQALTVQNTGAGYSGTVRIYAPSGTTAPKNITAYGMHYNATNAMVINSVGFWNGNTAVDGFQILFSTGNITSGTVKIYGRK